MYHAQLADPNWFFFWGGGGGWGWGLACCSTSDVWALKDAGLHVLRVWPNGFIAADRWFGGELVMARCTSAH